MDQKLKLIFNQLAEEIKMTSLAALTTISVSCAKIDSASPCKRLEPTVMLTNLEHYTYFFVKWNYGKSEDIKVEKY